MKNVYEEYLSVWPEESRKILKPLLSTIEVMRFPQDTGVISHFAKPAETIVIIEKGGTKEIMNLLSLGFHHCIQASRSDFAQELLASSMMILRPQAFHNDPVPFFLSGFSGKLNETQTKESLRLSIKRNSEKTTKLNILSDFLNSNAKVAGIYDLVIQVADEMLSNALFSAPRDVHGSACYHDLDRRTDVIMPPGKEVGLFACFTADRIILGCEDRYGSLERSRLLGHLTHVFNQSQIAPNEARAGAGLGIRYMIENSSNFYVFSQKGIRSMVICGFLLKGMKANLMADRHIHLSIA